MLLLPSDPTGQRHQHELQQLNTHGTDLNGLSCPESRPKYDLTMIR